MGKINVLGFEIANLIAAGEVVDRPSSVVKELLENAIDSGANKIIIEIKNGGSTFIRIADNGCGMEFDDLPVAILRHATSKIKSATDLESIMTLGFRGEALAAISSVSKVRIMSRQEGKEMGALLEAHGGQILTHIETGCMEGTTVIVEDLFYNVPARKKFLKKDASETASISSVVEKVAMSRPDISFRYIVDGEVKYLTAGDGNLQNVIYAILGRDVAKKTIKVEREDGGIKVEGFISTPEIARSSRSLETFFVNSRFIRSKALSAVLEEAYNSYIPQGKFPFCVLNITIDPTTVDVNVHPSKLEVKFSNERIINQAVYYAVRSALSQGIERPSLYNENKDPVSEKAKQLINAQAPIRDKEAPLQRPEKIVFDANANVGVLRQNNTIDYSSLDMSKFEAPRQAPVKIEVPEEDDFFSLKFPKKPSKVVENKEEIPNKPFVKEEKVIAEEISLPVDPVIEEKAPENNVVVPEYKIIGEAFNSYVIIEMGDIVYLVDKHAAHERIIFEDLKSKYNSSLQSSQLLLIPVEVTLDTEEIATAIEWQSDIEKTGFHFEITGNLAQITEYPVEIELPAVQDSFLTLVSKLTRGESSAEMAHYERFERALYQTSCKAAIKAGRIYDEAHIKWICDRVLTLDNIKYCPHGRPVAFEITKDFLEKQFERK
ncbi:MAG: DNA mismatch repair endonuclease MutL [Clostridia bacterium]|nr:DNA mismatch repair endonuclease MutL [Clostridia bacterium]